MNTIIFIIERIIKLFRKKKKKEEKNKNQEIKKGSNKNDSLK